MKALSTLACSALVINAFGLLAGPAPAQAAPCSQWGFNGDTTFNQTNAPTAAQRVLIFNSTGPTAQGPASFGNDPAIGYVSGGIVNGQGIDMQLHLNAGDTYRYSGEVDANGAVSGNIYGPQPAAGVTPPYFGSYTATGLKCLTSAAPPPAAGATSVQIKSGPATMQAGLSGTYVVTVTNTFTEAKPVRVFIIFSGKLEQTGQINAQGGLDCTVGHDAGINAAVNCQGPIPQGSFDIAVQGRGSSPGAGQLLVKLDNDTKQQNVTIT